MKKMGLIVLFILFSTVLFGCQQNEESSHVIEGYIFKVHEESIMLAQDIDLEKYQEIKEKEHLEIGQEGILLISISYDDTSHLKEGDHVKAFIEGGIRESYPAQANASKIEIIE